VELFKTAVNAVLLDEGFDVPSVPAQKAIEAAKCALDGVKRTQTGRY